MGRSGIGAQPSVRALIGKATAPLSKTSGDKFPGQLDYLGHVGIP
jgi:hypothetical protein